jgi:hypothetical protein
MTKEIPEFLDIICSNLIVRKIKLMQAAVVGESFE